MVFEKYLREIDLAKKEKVKEIRKEKEAIREVKGLLTNHFEEMTANGIFSIPTTRLGLKLSEITNSIELSETPQQLTDLIDKYSSFIEPIQPINEIKYVLKNIDKIGDSTLYHKTFKAIKSSLTATTEMLGLVAGLFTEGVGASLAKPVVEKLEEVYEGYNKEVESLKYYAEISKQALPKLYQQGENIARAFTEEVVNTIKEGKYETSKTISKG